MVVAIVFLAAPNLFAYGTIAWNSFVDSATPAVNLTSTGALMDAGFVFELGVFDAGYIPDPARKWEWQSKWHSAQSKTYNAVAKNFYGSYQLTSKPIANAPPFTVGAKAYIWGKRGTPGNAEWILMRKTDWLWPVENDVAAGGLNWRVREANQIILGTVNANPTGTPFLMKSAAVTNLWAEFQATALAGETLNGPNDDPDHDGVCNLLEFAYVTNPLSAGEYYFPKVLALDDAGQSYLTMRVERNIDNAILTVQVSSDLVNWYDTGATTVKENSPEYLIVRDNTPITPALPVRFMRLKARLP